jgi:Zinc carboxypeptidase
MSVQSERTRLWVAVLLAALVAAVLAAPVDAKKKGDRDRHKEFECIEYAENEGNHEFDDYYQPWEVDRAVWKLELQRGVDVDMIGLSHRGRPIHAVRMGHGRRVVMVQAGIHANELTGTTAVLDLLKDLTRNSRESRKLLSGLTLVVIPMLNPDGAHWYQRENDQTWAETEAFFPQLAGGPPAFHYSLPGPRFWSNPRVAGYDLNRDFNPDFGYVPQKEHLPGSGSVRGMNLTRESKISQGLYAQLEREFGTVDVFVDLHNQAPCNTFDHDGDEATPDRYTPMSISAQFLRNPAAHGAGTTYPKFDYDASRRATVAAWLGTQRAGRPASDVTRYPQNLDLAGSANSSYQLRGSASVLMEAGRQRHANPEWNLPFIASVHRMAVKGILEAVSNRSIDRIDPEKYERIPVRN